MQLQTLPTQKTPNTNAKKRRILDILPTSFSLLLLILEKKPLSLQEKNAFLPLTSCI